ncbi:glycine cleavage system protein GcvH [Acidipila sp. EB88]|uniref:glycine cleavage system protein GcvH n=1 Tax=Acidipila sp. EB88 TaxID=2305226 RepID=UPI000F5D6AD9|nr:glycine cleavage system protein GcvH [Acidipila sp. EB88]RRA48569.1 glycine cleavage system protein GcvH [Acidipila sp. EB88]
MSYPDTYRYTREHEWIHVENGVGTVGITDHAQSTLGDIVFVEAPKVGASVEKSKVFGSVESVKAVSDLYAPASGEVTSVNDELATAPESLNTDPHGAWIMRIQLSSPAEIDGLLSAADYEKFVSEETGH